MASAGRLSIGGTGRSCPFVNVTVVRAEIHLGATRQELTHESLDLCVRLSPLGHINFWAAAALCGCHFCRTRTMTTQSASANFWGVSSAFAEGELLGVDGVQYTIH